MTLTIHPSVSGLPSRLPIGATYVVEGYGGEEGKLQVVARYVVLPDGQRINVPAEPSRTTVPRVSAARQRQAFSNEKPALGGP